MINYINDFCVYLREKKNYSENTRLSYERDLRQFCLFLAKNGIDKIEKVNRTNIISYMLFMQKSDKSTATVLRNMSALKTFFKYMTHSGIIKSDPTDDIENPKAEKKMPGIITPGDIDAILSLPSGQDAKSIRDKAMLEVLYATGIRVSELTALRLEDVNIQLQYISCGGPEKERIIPIGTQAADALKNYLENAREHYISEGGSLPNRSKSPPLFVNRNGSPMTRQGFWKIIKNIARSAGVEGSITPQTLRHSFAAHLVENGADLMSVKEMLGHADVTSTQVYARLQSQKLREVYAAAHPRYK